MLLKFQFLNGTIKRNQQVFIIVVGDKFQFLNGTIKSKINSNYFESFKKISIPKWYD